MPAIKALLLAIALSLSLACLTACENVGVGNAAGSETSSSAASSSTAAPSSAATSSSAEPTDIEDKKPGKELKPKKKVLKAILGNETAALLIKRAESDMDAAWIAAHPDAYEKFGAELQEKLLKLAADDPLAIPFVRGFPKKAYADGPNLKAPAMDKKIHVKGIPKTRIPHLYQWDLRWGYAKFSADGFGLAACGPTSLTMIYQGLTGKTDITPYDMGRMAEEQGYVIAGSGSTNDLFIEMPLQLGLNRWEIPVNADSIRETLSAGYPIIANVGPGYFSRVGHFFVLAGITEDGKVILNDPYSVERSSKLWDPEQIASESRALYAYDKA